MVNNSLIVFVDGSLQHRFTFVVMTRAFYHCCTKVAFQVSKGRRVRSGLLAKLRLK